MPPLFDAAWTERKDDHGDPRGAGGRSVPLLTLYLHLHETTVPQDTAALRSLWLAMLTSPWQHVLVAAEAGEVVSSCVVTIVPNLTRGQRPYALVENVVTAPAYRGRGLATACLRRARELAVAAHCYRLMLLTGSKEQSTLDFYRRAEYSSEEKTGFVLHLD